MNKINYNSSDNIYIVDSRYDNDRSMGSGYYRGLIYKCERAEARIVNIINNNNFFKIINNEDDGGYFKIRNFDNEWYDDESPILFEIKFISDDDFKQSVLNLLNDKVSENKNTTVNNEVYDIVLKIEEYSLIIDKIKIFEYD